MVNKHQFQLLAKSFRAGKISLSEFTEQAYNPPADAGSPQAPCEEAETNDKAIEAKTPRATDKN